MRLRLGIAALAALGCAAVSATTASAAPSATAASQGAEEMRLLGELGKGGSAYAAAVQEALGLELFAIDGARRALGVGNGDATAGAGDWTTAWRGQLADKIAQLKAHEASLHYPLDAVDGLARLSPEFASRAATLRETPIVIGQDIDNVLSLAAVIDADVGAAAARDPKVMAKLRLDVVDGVRVQLEGENAMTRLAAAAAGPDHPQTALAESMAASNRAMIEVYNALDAQLRGQGLDIPALAKRVGGQCDEARSDAQRIDALAASSWWRLDAKGAISPAAQAGLYKGWDTYAESARVEVAIADECSKISLALTQGASLGGALTAASQLKPLVEQRIAIDGQRRADMTGAQ